jgi:hypothetical protein
MDNLWLFAQTGQIFLTPLADSVVSEDGLPLCNMMKCQFDPKNAKEFESLCERADCIILVTGDREINIEYLRCIPFDMPCVALINGDAPIAIRKQLDVLSSVTLVFSPFSQVAIAEGIKKSINNKNSLRALKNELKNYTDIAFTAMSSASEMGVVAFYAQAVQNISSFDRLAQQTLRCLKDLSVQGFIQFSFDDSVHVYPENVSKTYRDLLEWTRTSQHRIVSEKRFLIFNFENAQLLIIDAPFENTEKYGRLRDVVAHIASIAEARAKTIKVNGLLKAQQKNTNTVIMLLEMATRDNRNSVRSIMTDLSMALREMAMGLELTLEQETAMLKLSEKALESLESLHETTDAVEIHFRSLLLQLDQAAKLLHTNNEESESVAETSVELF